MEPNSAGRRATSTSALVEHLQWLLANTGRIPPASLQGLSLGPADLASIARQDPFVASQVARSLGAAPRAPRSTPPPEAPAVASGAGEDAGWVIEEHPPLGFEAVIGYDALKERIRRQVIVPLQFPNDHHVLDIALATGMILAGPSGVGKTRFCRAIAGEIPDARFVEVKASDIMGSYYGQTQRRIASLFATARLLGRIVVALDELETIFPARSLAQHEVTLSAVGQLLKELSDLRASRAPVFVIGATNRPEALDPALVAAHRLGPVFHIPLPDAAVRRALFRRYLQVGPGCSADVDVERWVRRTAGRSGADVEALCTAAKLWMLADTRPRGLPLRPLTAQDLERAWAERQPLAQRATSEV
jgi:SpoVK/Ycf46/Vps4 family AAA+-type ATPase